MRIDKIMLLSPHHDDIAFSLGGMIAMYHTQGISYYLVNIFNKTCYCLPDFETKDINEQRNIEDDRFAKRFGLIKTNLGLSDSSVLGHTAHSETISSPSDIRRPILIRELNSIFKHVEPDRIFCPIGIGGHIDHRMVKEVCLEMFRGSYNNLVFYEDLPYAYDCNPKHIESIISKAIPLRLHAKCMDITSIWDVKEKSILLYESQVNKEIMGKLRKYAQRLGENKHLLERIWIPYV